MSGNFTNFLRDELLDEVFGGQAYTPPTSLYIALSTDAPTDDDGTNFTGGEPVGNNYERVVVTNDLTSWEASVDGFKQNAIDFEFNEATGTWGTITHFAIFDGARDTDENMLAFGELTIAKEILEGDTATFNAGDLEITLSGQVNA